MEAPLLIDAVSGYIEASLPRWVTSFQELIRIPSEFEREHAIVEYVSRRIEGLGLRPELVEHQPSLLKSLPNAQRPISAVPGRNSVVARVPGTAAGRSLVVNTHLDIVPAGNEKSWTHPPFAGDIDRERNVIYGRGAMDDKAGVAVALALLETIRELRLSFRGDVVFHFVLEDETTGNGSMLCLAAGHGADAALILDGTRSDKAIDEHAGQLQFEITVQGKPASVSVSHMGVNAAEVIARLLLAVRDSIFQLNEARKEPWTRFPSPFQLVVQRISSEGAQLTVPDLAVAQCYMTFPPPHTLKSIQEVVSRTVDDFTRENRLPNAPLIQWNGFAAEPVRSPSSALVDVMRAVAADRGMPPIDIGPSTGTSDMRHFAWAGIPCLLYGPGAGFNPHRADEHYYLDDFSRMVAFYIGVFNSWCNRDG